jgi:hypothetical protein
MLHLLIWVIRCWKLQYNAKALPTNRKTASFYFVFFFLLQEIISFLIKRNETRLNKKYKIQQVVKNTTIVMAKDGRDSLKAKSPLMLNTKDEKLMNMFQGKVLELNSTKR